MKLRALIVVVLLAAAAVGTSVSTAQATICDPSNIKGGLKDVPTLTGCQKHHIISQWALGLAGIPEKYWPILNVLTAHHKQTANYGNRADRNEVKIEEFGDLEDPANGETPCKRLLTAFQKHADRFMKDMADPQKGNASKDWLDAYQREIDRMTKLLTDIVNSGECVRDFSDSLGMLVRPSPSPAPATVGATHLDDPTPPPDGGDAAATADSSLTASGSGLPTSDAGTEYDLVIADSAQLAKNPSCSASDTIISAQPSVVDTMGNIPLTSAVLGTMYWESGGEQDDHQVAPGRAQLCFAKAQDHLARSTAPVDVMVYPPATVQPAIYPPTQSADSSCSARYTVGVPRASTRPTTLTFNYGDGSPVESWTIREGFGSTTFSFSHQFSCTTTKAYTQQATITETNAFSVSETAAVIPLPGVPPGLPGLGGPYLGDGGGGFGGGRVTITSINGSPKGCDTDANPPPLECTATANVNGTPITAKATGARPHTTYYLTFLNKVSDQDGTKSCTSKVGMIHSSGWISGPVESSSTGKIPYVAGTIPGNIHAGEKPVQDHLPHNGVASLCFTTSTYSYITADATILVTGGSS